MNFNSLKQILLFGLQIPFSLIIFELPGFTFIKAFFLKILFKSKLDLKVKRGTYFITSHATIKGIGKLKIGNNVLVKSYCELDYSGGLFIGDNVRIASNVFITTHGHDFNDGSYQAQKNNIELYPLTIEDNVVIGTGAKILNSVSVIGEGSIIGAGAVIIKDVAPRTIMMGNIARPFIKRSIAIGE